MRGYFNSFRFFFYQQVVEGVDNLGKLLKKRADSSALFFNNEGYFRSIVCALLGPTDTM